MVPWKLCPRCLDRALITGENASVSRKMVNHTNEPTLLSSAAQNERKWKASIFPHCISIFFYMKGVGKSTIFPKGEEGNFLIRLRFTLQNPDL